MRSLVVVEAQKAVERVLELREPYGVATAKLDPPVLVQDRSLQPADEAIGPRMTRLRARVADPEIAAKSPWNSLPRGGRWFARGRAAGALATPLRVVGGIRRRGYGGFAPRG